MMNEQPCHSRKKTAAILLKLLVVFIALQALVLACPKVFPSLVVPMLPAVAFLTDADYALEGVRLTRRDMVFEVKSTKLSHFHLTGGQPGPTVLFDGSHQNSAINIYPVLVLTVLLVLPAPWVRKASALGLGCLLVLVLGLFDCSVALHWLGAEFLQASFLEVRGMVPGTAENAATFAALQEEIRRLTRVKSFLSTGGRQFLSLLAVGISLLIALQFQRTEAPADEEDAADSDRGTDGAGPGLPPL